MAASRYVAAQALVIGQNALRFTCDETIVHDPGIRPRVYRFQYVYRYREGDGLDDYRMPRMKPLDATKSGKVLSFVRG